MIIMPNAMLYLDDETYKIWKKLPHGERSQTIRHLLIKEYGGTEPVDHPQKKLESLFQQSNGN
jgi:hypothetical protein